MLTYLTGGFLNTGPGMRSSEMQERNAYIEKEDKSVKFSETELQMKIL